MKKFLIHIILLVSFVSLGVLSLHQNDQGPTRRAVLKKMACLVGIATSTVIPSEANAGEVGRRITEAVTTSDLGVTVRRSVVKGAQVMDDFDSKWEQWSDKYGLGTARKKQPNRPVPKVIPDLKPLDQALAQKVLQASDQCFLGVTNLKETDLKERIRKVQDTVRPSFERAGLSSSSYNDQNTLSMDGPQFNFQSYIHFKAYSDLVIDKNINFQNFRNQFESRLGTQLIQLFLDASLPMPQPSSPMSSKPEGLITAFRSVQNEIDRFCRLLVERGFVAQIDASLIDPEMLTDWSQDISDLQWSIALDGDVSQNAQILLQEQGFRLYPNFARFAIRALLQSYLPGQSVDLTDYYMDTNYNSDPNKFDVKEVLLSIIIESE